MTSAASRMGTQSDRLRGIRNLALLLAALSFLIVLVSAYIRLSGAGLSCAGWPDCYGQLLVGGPHPHSGAIRILHRVTASVALVLGFVLVWRCQRPDPIRPLVAYATSLVMLMIALTVVGLWSSDPHRVWASFFNMLGGLGLVVLSFRVVLAAGPGPFGNRAAGKDWLARAGLLALVAALALGALIGARYAATSCTSVPFCAGTLWPSAEGWAAINPIDRIAVATRPGDAGGIALHLLHRYCAVAALLLLGLAGLRALAVPATRTYGAGLLVLLGIEFALGSLTVASGFSLWLAIGHSVGAALLLAVTVHFLTRPAA